MSLSASVHARVTGIALAAMLLLGASGTHAADQLVFGKKLLIKNPSSGTTANKVVHLSKDATVTVGTAGSAGDPQCTGAGGGGTSNLRVAASGGAGDVTIPLPCGGWTTNGTNTLYKYKDSTGASCKLVLVKAGVLVKAVCKGSQVAIDLNGTMSPVAVVTTLNTEVYCTEFGGTVVHDGSDDKTFLRKDAASPSACPPGGTTTTTSTVVTTSTTTTVGSPCQLDAFFECVGDCPTGESCEGVCHGLNLMGLCTGGRTCGCAGNPACSTGSAPMCGGNCPSGASLGCISAFGFCGCLASFAP